jgi:hypothetical protein
MLELLLGIGEIDHFGDGSLTEIKISLFFCCTCKILLPPPSAHDASFPLNQVNTLMTFDTDSIVRQLYIYNITLFTTNECSMNNLSPFHSSFPDLDSLPEAWAGKRRN